MNLSVCKFVFLFFSKTIVVDNNAITCSSRAGTVEQSYQLYIAFAYTLLVLGLPVLVLVFLLAVVLLLSFNNLHLMQKKSFFIFFFTSQTLKPDWTEPNPNAIGRLGVPSLQVSFDAQYVKTEILGLVQKLPSKLTGLNQLHP